MKEINGPNRILFGERKTDNAMIYLSKPKWDCDWYWSFGYLGNRDEHYHLKDYQNGINRDMIKALSSDYKLAPKIEKNLWVFCELAKTAYILKETAEVLGRGGSHYTTNPLAELIKNPTEVKRINEEVLPAIFNKIAELIN